MSYKLFLDDVRSVDMVYDKSMEHEFVVVRSVEDFITCIQNNGLPRYISFDNDLGLDAHGALAPDGYAAAKWLVYDMQYDLRDLEFYVHSANPVAAQQIQGLLDNYIKFLKES